MIINQLIRTDIHLAFGKIFPIIDKILVISELFMIRILLIIRGDRFVD